MRMRNAARGVVARGPWIVLACPLLELCARGLSVHGACVRSHVAGQLLCVTRARACGDTLPFPFFIRTAISNAPPLFARLYESPRDWRFGQFFTTQSRSYRRMVPTCIFATRWRYRRMVHTCIYATRWRYSRTVTEPYPFNLIQLLN